MSRRFWFQVAPVVAGLALGVVLFVLLLHTVSGARLGSAFSRADYRYIVLAAIPFAAIIWIKVVRWALLFGADAPTFGTLFGALNAGYAVNTLLPLRVGELVAAYWVRDRSGVGMIRTLSTIGLERVSDGLAVFLLLVVTAPTVAFPRRVLLPAVSVGMLLGAALVAMTVLTRAHDAVWLDQRLTRWERGALAPVARVVRQAATGLQTLRDPIAVLRFLAYTALIWSANALLLWLVARAFHLDVPIIAGFLLTGVLYLGMAVPSSPGYIGVFDYLMVLTLGLYGVPHAPAVAAAFAAHVINFVPVTIVGLIYLAHQGWSTTARLLRASPG